MTRFAELLGRTCFSFLEGSSHPEEMVVRSSELGQRALAICDRDGLYGVVRAHAEGKKLGHPVLVGAEFTLEGEGAGEDPLHAPRLALIAEDHDGYGRISELLTRAHAEHEKGTAGIALAEIAASPRGLTAIVPLDAPWLPHASGSGRGELLPARLTTQTHTSLRASRGTITANLVA